MKEIYKMPWWESLLYSLLGGAIVIWHIFLFGKINHIKQDMRDQQVQINDIEYDLFHLKIEFEKKGNDND